MNALRRLTLASAVAVAVLAPLPTSACLGEYRSLDWMVGHATLIFVGTGESVEKAPSGREDARRGPSQDGPTVATVKIVRVLHGTAPDATIRLRSGPVAS